jgi:hypothetical protein
LACEEQVNERAQVEVSENVRLKMGHCMGYCGIPDYAHILYCDNTVMQRIKSVCHEVGMLETHRRFCLKVSYPWASEPSRVHITVNSLAHIQIPVHKFASLVMIHDQAWTK